MATSLPPRDDQVLAQPPKLAQDASIDAKLKTKLQLEASLEANRTVTLPIIAPEDIKTHQANAVEQSTHYNERTLLYYTEMEEALDVELRSMDESLARCREIEAKLLEDNEPDTEAGEITRIVRRIRSCNKTFKEFRNVLRQHLAHLKEKYPQMNIGDVMSSLATQMMDHPNEPYKDMDEIECDEKTFNFLLKFNIVQRHPQEPRKMKMIDPRLN